MIVLQKQPWKTAKKAAIFNNKKNKMDILQFITAGSVDDGKSTLIGRLLYDSKQILTDQLEAIERSSKNRNAGEIDLALLTDGLRAEREQGITIDVAYRYFSTEKRKFIIADAPGHIQYTRNMITGASKSNLIIILIDARQGVIEQTRRHSIIAALLKIPHIIVAINKMDLVNYAEKVYTDILTDYALLAQKLGLEKITYFPISALNGDNVVTPSLKMPWYNGNCLLKYLEDVKMMNKFNLINARFQVQYIIRPQTAALPDYRGYAGRISSGIYKKGEQITVLPQNIKSTITKIEIAGVEVEEAFAPQSVVIHLEDDIDISRGDTLVKTTDEPSTSNDAEVLLCWLSEKPLQAGNKYLFQQNSSRVRTIVQEVYHKIDVNTLNPISNTTVQMNDIAVAKIKTASPILAEAYNGAQEAGCGILIDETSNATVAAVMIH
jgi:sulfate adenylyltransferase subunit 1